MCWQNNLSKQELVDRNKNFLGLKNYRQILKDLSKMGAENIIVSGGGEPLMYPHINELLKIIKQYNFRGELITNGLRLDTNQGEFLTAIGWDFIRFSVDASDVSTYNQVKGLNGKQDKFAILLNNIRDLIKARNRSELSKPVVALNYVIQKANRESIAEFISMAANLSVDEIHFKFLSPFGNKNKRKELGISLLERKNLIRTIDDELKRYSNSFSKVHIPRQQSMRRSMGRPFCILPWSSIFINHNGDINPCCFSEKKVGSLKDDNLSGIWNGKNYKSFRQKISIGDLPQECIKCELKYSPENIFLGALKESPVNTSLSYLIERFIPKVKNGTKR
jgi:radical SAM protein with 4Fe4S-binding SPASM domain